MSGSSDDERTRVAPERATKHQQSTSFDLDDAFSDGEDHDPEFKFSSAAIREDLARNASWLDAEHGSDDGSQVTSNGWSENAPHDTSVSTIDIDGPGLDSSSLRSVSQSEQSHTPEDSINSNDFSQISLSDDVASEHAPERDHLSDSEPDEEGHTDEPYPSVHIDASKSPSSRVEIGPIFVPAAGSQLDLPPLYEQDDPQTPHSAPASSASHTIPLPEPSTPTAVTSPTKPAHGHRPTRSMGPSALEKVISKTRPSFLPPKNKQEDNKHMADWEKMMKLSRAAEDKRRKTLQERRLAREKKVEESLSIWEKNIVPDWRVVHKNPALRKLWWGGIPTTLRASMWERAVGNALALSKDNYRTCFARAKRALTAGTFPLATLEIIESDIISTLPSLHIFHPSTGPLYQDLRDMLCAWVVSRSDEGLGYTFGIAKIAAMFLITMPAQQGFIVMRNLLERHCMRSFYGGKAAKDDVEAYYRIFDTLLADGMPKIYFNFKQHQISPAAYLPDWLLPLFLNHLPFEACARIWDVLLLEGDSFLYRASLGILAVLESRLFFPDRKELLELLRGENKPALEVARRDGRPLDGGKYEIYGVDEETLWERIDSMDDWWKESTWTRLIQRELPDL